MKRRLLNLLTGLLVLLVTGCTVSDRDVSDDPRFRVGYLPGQVYRLERPAGLVRLGDDYFELVRPGDVKAYGRPAGTLAAGTLMRIVALRHTVIAAPVQWESGVVTTAELVGPPHWTVALNDLSGVRWVKGDRGTTAGVLVPDPQWLALSSECGLGE